MEWTQTPIHPHAHIAAITTQVTLFKCSRQFYICRLGSNENRVIKFNISLRGPKRCPSEAEQVSIASNAATASNIYVQYILNCRFVPATEWCFDDEGGTYPLCTLKYICGESEQAQWIRARSTYANFKTLDSQQNPSTCYLTVMRFSWANTSSFFFERIKSSFSCARICHTIDEILPMNK